MKTLCVPDDFVPQFCECGGYLSATLGSTTLTCLKCNTEFKIQKVQENA